MKRSEYEVIWVDGNELSAWVESAVENGLLVDTPEAREKYRDALEAKITKDAKERYPNASIIICGPGELNSNSEWMNAERSRELPTSMYDCGAAIPDGCEVEDEADAEAAETTTKRSEYEVIWVDADYLPELEQNEVDSRVLADTPEAREKYQDAWEAEITKDAKERYPNASIIICNPSELNGNGEWGNTRAELKRELPRSMYDCCPPIPDGCAPEDVAAAAEQAEAEAAEEDEILGRIAEQNRALDLSGGDYWNYDAVEDDGGEG